MAYCQTTRWVSTSPYVKLTVTEDASAATETTAKLTWTLQYISDYAPSTSSARAYSVKIAGETVKEGTFDINGKTGTITIASGSVTGVARGTAAKSIAFSVSFAFNLSWSGSYKGTLTASGSISIAAKTSYTIKYSANGGSGAPSSQTKWHGTNIKLSNETPTRSGYTFKGWGTSASATTVSYAAGATYSSNANITLYAIWTASGYTVKYDANGGTGAPSNQTKTHGVNLTLSSTKPTRTNYTFKGWGTSASATTVSYAAGASYTKDASITLYAVWEQSYTKPKITNLSVTRCDKDKNKIEDGTYALVEFSWTTSVNVASIAIDYQNPNSTTWYGDTSLSSTVTNPPISGKSGSVSVKMAKTDFSVDNTYGIRITVRDSSGNTSVTRNLPAMRFPIDMKPDGVSIGKPATESNLFDVAWASRFSENTYVGESKAWDDGLGGTKLSPHGGIVIQRESGSSPYLDFRFYGTKNTYDGRIIYATEVVDDEEVENMKFLGATGSYSFDNSILSGAGLGLGRNDTAGTKDVHINMYWADGAKHDMITRGGSGLTSAFGWAGATNFTSNTYLRGNVIKLRNASGNDITSDERLKKDFLALDKWSAFYYSLEPIAFKMRTGTSGRYHIGFKAQQVEKALTDNGLTTKDFAGFVKSKYEVDEDDPEGSKVYAEAGINQGDDEYGLIYTEFIALNTYMIQKLLKENTELKERLAKLEESMNM